MDMLSINDFLTEVYHQQIYRIFRNDKHLLFSRLTFNHRVGSPLANNSINRDVEPQSGRRHFLSSIRHFI